MSSTILLPSQRLSFTGFIMALIETVAAVLVAAYSREDDIEPFGL
jgi:hypothetical protein